MITTEALYGIFRKHPNVVTDTRNIKEGDLFFALRGPNFNANTFAEKALAAGAAFVVVDDPDYVLNDRCLLTKDVLKCLQQLALFHRRQLKIPVIGITGSNGKTTTKELIHAVLSKRYRTLATTGNLNNHIGVPLTLLSINDNHELAIIEMGANHIGEIRDLSAIALPDYGIITSIGKAHLEGFGSFEGVIKAKTELYDFIRKNKGKIFVNSENDLLMGLSSGAERILYGSKSGSLVKGKVTGMDPFVQVTWEKGGRGEKQLIHSQLIGQYNFENILAAVCVGVYFGLKDLEITSAIENYVPSNNRSQLTRTAKNTLILDAYNANPSSLTAAIENFSLLEGDKVVVVGDMLELGSESTQEHRNIAVLIASKKFSNVLYVGEEFGKLKAEFEAHFFNNTDQALDWLNAHPIEGATILVKGSRGVKLEKLITAL
jgi:UDP-N-acetylmuramoyl-tripeptide--D-alanyl-D-alanine ligase